MDRKRTFLLTMVIMGIATGSVGILPSYSTAGLAAPIALIAARMLQGLAVGGEYGGAAIYVAEHFGSHQRGVRTSWIQATGTAGLLLSLIVIMLCRAWLGPAFDTWGWRLPFLFSVLLLALSVYIRLQLGESPVFLEMAARGERSTDPVAESFGRWRNLRTVLLVLFGSTAITVIYYCGQFYSLFFLTQVLKAADPTACSLQLDVIGKKRFVRSCDIVKSALAKAGIPYRNARGSGAARIVIGYAGDIGSLGVAAGAVRVVPGFEGEGMDAQELEHATANFRAHLQRELGAVGYPSRADPARIDIVKVLALLSILLLYIALTFGPFAAWLVEFFPPRIRYTSISVPYHIAVGWIGGFLPTVAFAIVAITGDIYSGLWYPVSIAAASALLGALFLPETLSPAVRAQ